MPKKEFDYQFEDIRRESTPVSAAGFGDMVEEPENPDEAFVDVDLNADDVDDAVSVADPDDDALASTDDDDNAKQAKEDKRRQVLEARRTEQLESDLAEGREEFAGEVNSLKKKVAGLEAEKEIDAIEVEYGSKEEKLTAEMEQAMEDGDSKASARINTELIALNTEKQAKKAAAEASVTIIEDLDADQPPAGEQPASKRAMQFIRDNTDWWSDPDHEDGVEYARKLDRKLVEMGLNPESDAYWTRFNHNFDKKFPDLRVEDPDDIDIDFEEPDKKRGRKKSPVSQPGGAGDSRRRDRGDNGQGSVVRLTAQHKANMSRFGLDPQNPEHCANYAKEVQASQKADDRRAAQ